MSTPVVGSTTDAPFIVVRDRLTIYATKQIHNLSALTGEDLSDPPQAITIDLPHVLVTYPDCIVVVTLDIATTAQVWARPKGIAVQGCVQEQVFVKNSSGVLRINSVRMKDNSLVKSNRNDTSYRDHKWFDEKYFDSDVYWYQNGMIWCSPKCTTMAIYGWSLTGDRQSMLHYGGKIIHTSENYILMETDYLNKRMIKKCGEATPDEYYPILGSSSHYIVHKNEVMIVYIGGDAQIPTIMPTVPEPKKNLFGPIRGDYIRAKI